MLTKKADLTWSCHICKKERPDHLISVLTKDLIINGQGVGQENIRYCNDNSECWEGAKTFSLLKSSQEMVSSVVTLRPGDNVAKTP